MISLLDMLLGKVKAPVTHITKELPGQLPPYREPTPASVKTMSSYELNKHKTCTKEGCDKPRHISKNGRCHATTCTEHYKEDQEKFRLKYSKSLG